MHEKPVQRGEALELRIESMDGDGVENGHCCLSSGEVVVLKEVGNYM